MSKGRLEAFSDGVLAIILTIMVLELKAPHGSASRDSRRRRWRLTGSFCWVRGSDIRSCHVSSSTWTTDVRPSRARRATI